MARKTLSKTTLVPARSKRFTTILLIVSTIIAAIAGGSFVYVFANSGSIMYVEEGVYPHGVDYTFWVEGSTYYAKDANGHIALSSSNASYLIQTYIDSREQGGSRGTGITLFFKSGTYSLDTPLNMSGQDIHLLGEGIRDTVFAATSNINGPIISTENSYNFWSSIENINFEHENEPAQAAIQMTGCMSWTLRNIRIRGSSSTPTGIGILLQGAPSYGNYYCSFENVFISWEATGILMNETVGVASYQSNANWIYGGFIQHVDTGINITNGNGNGIFGTSIEHITTGGAAIYIGSDARETIMESITVEATTNNVVAFDLSDTSRNIVINPKTMLSGSGTTEFSDSARNDFVVHWESSYPTLNMLVIEPGSGGTTSKISSWYGAFECANGFRTPNYMRFVPITHPNTTGWGASQEGWMWYCDDHSTMEYWDGSSVQTFP